MDNDITHYRMTIIVEVDKELLATHDGDSKPPPNNVSEWYGGDLIAAIDEGIATIIHDEIKNIEPA